MGFLTNQLSPQNFQDHLVKTLKVICQEEVQQPNNQVTVNLEATPTEPITVTITPISFTAIVDQDKVFNTWTLEVAVTDAEGFTDTLVVDYREEAVVCPFDLMQWPAKAQRWNKLPKCSIG